MREFNKVEFLKPSSKEYFRDNVFSWYRYAQETKQPGLKNGSLFLVTATVHAPVWGMAVSRPAGSTTDKKKHKETPTYYQNGDNEHHYIWDSPYSNLLHCTGPTYDELKATSAPRNWCLAVAPFSIWLDDTTWNTHFEEDIGTATPGSSHRGSVPPSAVSSSKRSKRSLKSLFSRKSGKPVTC